MDQINSNPFFNSARLYQNQLAQQKTTDSVSNAVTPTDTTPVRSENAEQNDYSSIFDDDALLKLQSNLEAIAQMAEQSLKQIDS